MPTRSPAHGAGRSPAPGCGVTSPSSSAGSAAAAVPPGGDAEVPAGTVARIGRRRPGRSVAAGPAPPHAVHPALTIEPVPVRAAGPPRAAVRDPDRHRTAARRPCGVRLRASASHRCRARTCRARPPHATQSGCATRSHRGPTVIVYAGRAGDHRRCRSAATGRRAPSRPPGGQSSGSQCSTRWRPWTFSAATACANASRKSAPQRNT